MSTERKRILETLTSLNLNDFDDCVDNIIEMLNSHKEDYGFKGFTDIRVSVVRDYDEVYISLVGYREETDEEYVKRMKRNQKAAERREAAVKVAKDKERAEYEAALAVVSRLALKFGEQ